MEFVKSWSKWLHYEKSYCGNDESRHKQMCELLWRYLERVLGNVSYIDVDTIINYV